MPRSYNIDSIAYLRRARQCLDQHTREALFYAAFELRSGTESRLQDYLDARKDIAKHKKQGWKIMGSAKELDRLLRLGDTIFVGSFLDRDNNVVLAVYYTPITARLRESAGARLHDVLHTMKTPLMTTTDGGPIPAYILNKSTPTSPSPTRARC